MNYITMSKLGRHGRFANQIFQVAFLRIYAREHDLVVQNAPWVGEQLFGVAPSPVMVKLPPYHEPLKKTGQPFGPPRGEAIGCDFHGYAQYHTSYHRPHREFLCELFQPTQAIRDRLAPAAAGLGTRRQTRVGIHLRRGDYGRFAFYITPVHWYLNWLAAAWSLLDDPLLFVASEDRALVDEFAAYNPQTAESLGVDLQAEPLPVYHYQRYDLEHPEPHLLDFFPDWYLLTQCDILLIPNSTFSFAAAMFSERLRHCFRSDLPTERFVEIDPWDTEPMTRHLAEDYKHIPGVCLDENPQW